MVIVPYAIKGWIKSSVILPKGIWAHHRLNPPIRTILVTNVFEPVGSCIGEADLAHVTAANWSDRTAYGGL